MFLKKYMFRSVTQEDVTGVRVCVCVCVRT